jgi:type IV pilus assembly protein PilB
MVALTASRLEKYFVREKILTADEFAAAESNAAAQRQNVLTFLRNQGRVTHQQTCRAFAFMHGWTYEEIDDTRVISDEIIGLIEFHTARKLNVVPLSLDGDDLTVACINPFDSNVIKQLQSKTGKNIVPVYSSNNELTRAVGRFYSTSIEAKQAGEQAAKDLNEEARSYRPASVVVVGDEGNFVNTLDAIIEGALESGASDIHLEPAATHLSVRYSIDGKLHKEPFQPKELAPRLAGLIKTRARLSSSELTTQDGSFSYRFNDKDIDIRVAVLPAVWGESVTLRIGGGEIRELSGIGFAEDTEQAWRRSLAQPNGICLAVGPMGSGKTTLHYASLGWLMNTGKKIVSLEDPVEMRIPEGITQVPVNQNVSWEGGMATTLRSAAGVLFIGEINREAIAHTAIAAANTGHMVLSTLHTNDAPGAVLRLREMGLRPSVLGDTMRAVCAQRLPRVLCKCKVITPPSRDLVMDFKLTHEDLAAVDPATGRSIWYGPSEHGCIECNGLGYKGRLPIHELMTFPRHIRDLITEDVPNSVLAEAARANGMLTLQDDGLLKVRAGLTSLAEVRSHILID